MGPLAAAAKSALSPQEVLANMQFGAHLFKGTRSIRSITFVVMQADLWQEGRVILEQKLAEFIVAKSAVESVLSEHRVVVGRVEVVNKLAFLPGLLVAADAFQVILAEVQQIGRAHV